MPDPKYFIHPFGVDGDRTAIPETEPVSGAVNYDTGFPVDYQLDQTSDPDAKNIPRDQFNELLYQVTLAIQQNQQNGFPIWITAAANGGTSFPYAKGSTVRYTDSINYESQVDNNTVLPGSDATKWLPVSYSQAEQTGFSKKWWGIALPNGGFVWENGQSIGDASSGGTQLADPSAQALFLFLWANLPNSVCTIQDSSGTPVARGTSAASDWAAHRRITTPDSRGRVSAGNDAMGGAAAAGLLTASGTGNSGIAGSQTGATGGFQSNILDITQMPPHTHGFQITSNSNGGNGAWAGATVLATIQTNSAGGSGSPTPTTQPHANVQPTIITNWVIKL